MRIRPLASIGLVFSLFLASCGGTRPANLGIGAAGLAPCPSSPNCVSSLASDDGHRVPPLRFTGDPDAAWRAAREAVATLSRTRIVTETSTYLHAECRSALFGFIDDLELWLHADEGSIAVRSASRLGYGDMGVNRRRIEELRAAFRDPGLLAEEEARPAP